MSGNDSFQQLYSHILQQLSVHMLVHVANSIQTQHFYGMFNLPRFQLELSSFSLQRVKKKWQWNYRVTMYVTPAGAQSCYTTRARLSRQHCSLWQIWFSVQYNNTQLLNSGFCEINKCGAKIRRNLQWRGRPIQTRNFLHGFAQLTFLLNTRDSFVGVAPLSPCCSCLNSNVYNALSYTAFVNQYSITCCENNKGNEQKITLLEWN